MATEPLPTVSNEPVVKPGEDSEPSGNTNHSNNLTPLWIILAVVALLLIGGAVVLIIRKRNAQTADGGDDKNA